MEKILNFSEPLDVALLDKVVLCVYRGTPQERDAAQKVLVQFREHPDAWLKADTILEYSSSLETKFFALQILDSVIKYKWKILPRPQCEGIKNYIVNKIIKLSSDEATLHREKVFLNKLNLTFVQIIKQEWPANWDQLIPQIVSSSNQSESLCENNMIILKLLSEEIFDFSKDQITQAKIKELKTSLNKEFSLIYQLCEVVLDQSVKPNLLLVTLETLLRFLNWIPLGYIFETKMIDMLIFKFFLPPAFRNASLKCLIEIGSLSVGVHVEAHFVKLFSSLMTQLQTALPLETNIPKAYEAANEEDKSFIHNLSLFFTGFFRAHLALLERPETHHILIQGLAYLSNITMVPNDEIFKICLEYWNYLASDLYNEAPLTSPLLLASPVTPRRALYQPILTRVRFALIGRMAKPEEVLIVEDENGEIVKETVKDTDSIILYKSMRETLIFLTHLDYEDTQNIMLDKLQAQVEGREWSWHNLNTLCWAIGSISGALNEEDEKKFLVTVIKDLLGLCEMKRGKDNKAVIASNIMYIVGQYPRFLRAHWKFLKTVVNKLFEFMHETHPGVQDMACDTFLKISQKCRRKFVVLQIGETVPFIEEILANLPAIIQDLEAQQIHTFYEAVGWMIGCPLDNRIRDGWIKKFMELPNATWKEIMAQSTRNIEYLRQIETAKSISNILKTNVRAASSLGHCYITQLSLIYIDVLNIYKAYSEYISLTVSKTGTHATSTSLIRAMRAVKKESLRLLETFIDKSEDPQTITQNFIPPLLEAVLLDYKNNIPDARDPEVLSLLSMTINKLKASITGEIPRIFDAVFECTLVMITKNFEDYPDHRLNFFEFLKAINTHCFNAFFMIPQNHFKLVIDSIVWAFKHTMRNIAETGLNVLLEMWKNISTIPEVSDAFHRTFFLSLLQDLFFVLTDTFHKSSFKLQATMIAQMLSAVESGQVKVPLWDTNVVNNPGMTNQLFLREFITNLLSTSFKNLSPNQVQLFVIGLFQLNRDINAFKAHLRDFLVQLKEFSAGDNTDLFIEEKEAALKQQKQEQLMKAMAIPGMVAPNERTDDMTE